jgi:hypothetical protein
MKGKPTKRAMASAEQSARFIEAARKLGADERPEEFDKALKKIAARPAAGRSRPSGKRVSS